MTEKTRHTVTRRALMGGGAAVVLAGGTAYALRGKTTGRHFHAPADTFNRGNGAEPDTLDPHKASGDWENNIIGEMFMGLMTDDADGNAIYGAAESYEKSADGRTYRFRIRDHKWSDGKPVTAQDFVYSFRRILNPKTAAQYASILYPIRNAELVNAGKLPPEQVGVHAIDDRTLEIAFEFQVPYFAELLKHYTTFPVPRHIIEKYGEDSWLKPGVVVTNGPYVLTDWVPNDHIHLTRNPHFYDRDSVRIANVLFYPSQDYSAAVKRFRSGEFDIVQNAVPPQQVDWLRANLARELHLSPFILSQFIQFNVKRKPFDDVRVRKALSLPIDRKVIAEKIMRAGEQPAYALVPPGIPNYPGTAHVTYKAKPLSACQAEAKALLAQAGFGAASPLTFDYNVQNTTEAKLVGVALQEMWHEVGIAARLVISESQVHYDTLRRKEFVAAWSGWVADYRDAKNYLLQFESSSGDLNLGDYNSPRFDSLMNQSDKEPDVAKRAALLSAAEQTLLDEAGIAPVYFGVARDLVSLQVKGWKDNNLNVHRSRFVTLDRGDNAV